ncbi:hypothetical protein BV25DRAFT_928592 [Artomyces pyxidatus]|uniref:Uncharacterized protein n=1 Tax=Artomyces pyxidatus TaxID=48021 RepID=A0ACB8SWV7_9AGAM|nr:hypothetical protein BV25DRAFT_928592 [Artomyces pyxidatus]
MPSSSSSPEMRHIVGATDCPRPSEHGSRFASLHITDSHPHSCSKCRLTASPQTTPVPVARLLLASVSEHIVPGNVHRARRMSSVKTEHCDGRVCAGQSISEDGRSSKCASVCCWSESGRMRVRFVRQGSRRRRRRDSLVWLCVVLVRNITMSGLRLVLTVVSQA